MTCGIIGPSDPPMDAIVGAGYGPLVTIGRRGRNSAQDVVVVELDLANSNVIGGRGPDGDGLRRVINGTVRRRRYGELNEIIDVDGEIDRGTGDVTGRVVGTGDPGVQPVVS